MNSYSFKITRFGSTARAKLLVSLLWFFFHSANASNTSRNALIFRYVPTALSITNWSVFAFKDNEFKKTFCM